MNTPICDFIRSYCESDPLRMHMPGHKGIALTGNETHDITEIAGADSLYEASGIIRESEENASRLFGTGRTFYSTEGSSHAIRAMLYLTVLYAKDKGERPVILAARNAHKAFVTAAGLLDIDVCWLSPSENSYYLSSPIWDTEKLYDELVRIKPAALYITSPDYLGNTADIEKIAGICDKTDTLLLVDNAHGAYLKFLKESEHPIDKGAHMCCDSAHKTLPVLTGGAYLHLSKKLPPSFRERGKDALALFGSTSPSYLIMESLDAVNKYISDGYSDKLDAFIIKAESYKKKLSEKGFTFTGNEPLKWTIHTKSCGYTGTEFAEKLSEKGIICEFADNDFIVFMLSCEQGEKGLSRLCDALEKIPLKEDPESNQLMCAYIPKKAMSIHDALFMPKEKIETDKAEGRILASVNIACPPAVPIAVCGEIIDREVIRRFHHNGIFSCEVIKKE